MMINLNRVLMLQDYFKKQIFHLFNKMLLNRIIILFNQLNLFIK